MGYSNYQSNFMGGEIAPAFQGRADHPKYKTGLAVCFNSMPLETGAWQRRPGTRCAALTRGGVKARLIDFDFSQDAPYTMEFTAGHLRFFAGYSLVHTYDEQTVSAVSTANPAVVTVNDTNAWAAGDNVEFFIDATLTPDSGALLRGSQFSIGSASSTGFSLYNSVTGAGIDGSTLSLAAGTPIVVQRILDIPTSYTRSMIEDVRAIQALNNNVNTVVLLHNQVPAQALTSSDPPQPDFTLNAASFIDGPYLDPPTNGVTMTPSATNGTITLTASSATFLFTDINRHIRLLSQPPAWASGTGYTAGELVTYQNAYYVALQATTGNIPGADAVNWGVASNASAWVWGIITAVADSTHATVVLQVVSTATTNLPGVLVNTNAMTIWRMGVFNAVDGYAACGTYHEGRLWLSGVVGNRIDGSVPNDIFNFSPTAVDGTVSDANAIAYTFNSKDLNSIFWMTPQSNGIICGTQAGEWLVQASNNNDPLTPTSIQAHRVTKFGSANVEPVEAPFATLFVERNNRKMFEYLADVFTGKYAGVNLSLTGSHLSTSGIAEVRYQKELCPVAWVRMNDASFAGITYRRDSPMISSEAAMSGWHSHALGSGRSVQSIAIGPSVGGDLDALSLCTLDPDTGLYWVEIMTDMFPDNGTNLQAWYVDGGTTPAGSLISGSNLILYGLSNLEGETVSAWIAGVDAGDYAVSGGQITISLPAGYNGSGLLTAALLEEVNDPNLYGPQAMPVTYAQTPISALALQSYIGPTSPVAETSIVHAIFDAKNMRFFEFSEGSGSTNGIRIFDMMSGLQTTQATHDQIFGVGNPDLVYNPYTLGFDGYLYTVNGSANDPTFLKLDSTALRIVDEYGLTGSGNLPSYVPYPTTLAPVRVSDYSFLVAPSLGTPSQLTVLETTDGFMRFAGYIFTVDEYRAFSSPTYDGSESVFTVAHPDMTGPTTSRFGVYRTDILPGAHDLCIENWSTDPLRQNRFISTAKIAAISPSDVDATWTHFTDMSGLCYDQVDGNLLMFVQTSDAVTNQSYLIKINATTGAVGWTLPVTNIPVNGRYDMPRAYCAFNQFGFLANIAGATTLYKVNTNAGTATTVSVPGLNSSSAIWDSRVGSVFSNGNFTQTAGSPTLLNGTPTGFSGQWSRLVAWATFTTGRAFYTVPAAVGFTYTSKGQRLRPIDPQESGAHAGPALGKTRRNHRSAFLFLNTAAVAIGTVFAKVRAAIFKSLGGTAYAPGQLYSDVLSSTLEDNNSYDGQICWQVTRPNPATVLANEGFIETTDR